MKRTINILPSAPKPPPLSQSTPAGLCAIRPGDSRPLEAKPKTADWKKFQPRCRRDHDRLVGSRDLIPSESDSIPGVVVSINRRRSKGQPGFFYLLMQARFTPVADALGENQLQPGFLLARKFHRVLPIVDWLQLTLQHVIRQWPTGDQTHAGMGWIQAVTTACGIVE